VDLTDDVSDKVVEQYLSASTSLPLNKEYASKQRVVDPVCESRQGEAEVQGKVSLFPR
jgi:hypothetical protein